VYWKFGLVCCRPPLQERTCSYRYHIIIYIIDATIFYISLDKTKRIYMMVVHNNGWECRKKKDKR